MLVAYCWGSRVLFASDNLCSFLAQIPDHLPADRELNEVVQSILVLGCQKRGSSHGELILNVGPGLVKIWHGVQESLSCPDDGSRRVRCRRDWHVLQPCQKAVNREGEENECRGFG